MQVEGLLLFKSYKKRSAQLSFAIVIGRESM
jgi:hypothetical protein